MCQKKKLHLEILRIIAAFFVIFNHTGNNGFSLFTRYTADSASYWVFLAFSVACKISVPLFFMISGALLLGKSEEAVSSLAKRASKILMALLVFSFVSYVQQVHLGNEQFNLLRFFQVLFQSNWMNAFWYLYAYLAFLLALPFLRAIAKQLKDGHYMYLIALQLLFGSIIPIVRYLFLDGEPILNSHISFGWLLGNIPFYPLLGYWAENKLDIRSVRPWKLALLWLANIAGICISGYMTYKASAAAGAFTQSHMMITVSLHCICLYLTAKKLLINLNVTWLCRIIESLGSCTFGIYLLHGLILREPKLSIWKRLLASDVMSGLSIHPFISVMIRCAEVMAIAYLITFILKKIPFVKKIL